MQETFRTTRKELSLLDTAEDNILYSVFTFTTIIFIKVRHF